MGLFTPRLEILSSLTLCIHTPNDDLHGNSAFCVLENTSAFRFVFKQQKQNVQLIIQV